MANNMSMKNTLNSLRIKLENKKAMMYSKESHRGFGSKRETGETKSLEHIEEVILGVSEAIAFLDTEDEDIPDAFFSDYNLTKRFIDIINSTERKCSEKSRIFPVVLAVTNINDESFVETLAGRSGEDIRREVEDRTNKLIESCKAYIEKDGSSWTATGKQRTALVMGLQYQVDFLVRSLEKQDPYADQDRLKNFVDSGVKKRGTKSCLDFMRDFGQICYNR